MRAFWGIGRLFGHRVVLLYQSRVFRLVHCSLVTSLATIADAAGLWIKRGASPDRAGGLSHLLTLAFLQSSCSLATTLSHPLAPIVITPTKSTEGMLHLYPV